MGKVGKEKRNTEIVNQKMKKAQGVIRSLSEKSNCMPMWGQLIYKTKSLKPTEKENQTLFCLSSKN